MGFSCFSVALTALSGDDDLCPGGLGLRAAVTAGAGSLGVFWPDVAGCEFILLSDFIASFVENIRVSRFVIDGFSAVAARVVFCGSEGGAACPLLARLSELGTDMPFALAGRDSGDPTMDDVCDAGGEG
jgi:hypothetical protein